MKQRAFTILELLITLIAVSCLAALAIPAFFSQPEVTLENAAILLAQDLRTAQNRSAYQAEPCRFEFLPEGDGYRVLNAEGEVVMHPATQLTFLRTYSEDAVFRGVRIIDTVMSQANAILYDAQGRANDEARITLSFEGDLRTLIVGSNLGRIQILGSTSGWLDGAR